VTEISNRPALRDMVTHFCASTWHHPSTSVLASAAAEGWGASAGGGISGLSSSSGDRPNGPNVTFFDASENGTAGENRGLLQAQRSRDGVIAGAYETLHTTVQCLNQTEGFRKISLGLGCESALRRTQ
jgi:hypothetical protein